MNIFNNNINHNWNVYQLSKALGFDSMFQSVDENDQDEEAEEPVEDDNRVIW